MASWGRLLGTLALALALVACGGRDSWLEDPLPERPPVQPPAPVAADAPRVRVTTSVGELVLALYADRAPATVDNFLAYVDAGFYDGTVIHRVEQASSTALAVIQGGGYGPEFELLETRDPIPLETDPELSNVRGTIAMARLSDPDSATSQFFLNYLDNPALDPGEGRPGYAVFGVVTEGIDVVDRISMVPTGPVVGTRLPTAPMVEVRIERIRRE